MSGAETTVSASAAGKYLKAVATSGSSTVELVSANKVIAAGSLEAAVQKLNNANMQIAVDYSTKGGNVNDVLKAQLANLGFTDVDVKVSEGGVTFNAEDAKATVGISDAQDKTNGDVTFFYIDPNDYTGYNIDGLRSADVSCRATARPSITSPTSRYRLLGTRLSCKTFLTVLPNPCRLATRRASPPMA